MVPVKSLMVPKDKFITVERDMDVRSAGRVMRDRNIGSLFVTNGKDVIGILLAGKSATLTCPPKLAEHRWIKTC